MSDAREAFETWLDEQHPAKEYRTVRVKRRDVLSDNEQLIAEAAFQAGRASSPSALPPGWKAVPIEPTPEMKKAYVDRYGYPSYGAGHEYSFMLYAAPQAVQPAAISNEQIIEIITLAQHGIPAYAFGDNQAACEMDNRLSLIADRARDLLAEAQQPEKDHAAIASAAPSSMSDGETLGPITAQNQCDGCMQGAALRGNLHIDKNGHAFMACEKDRYTGTPGEREMKLRIEYCMAAADHMGIWETEIEAPWKVAFRLWWSTFSPKVFTSFADTTGNRMLENVLQAYDPAHRYPVSAIVTVKWLLLENSK